MHFLLGCVLGSQIGVFIALLYAVRALRHLTDAIHYQTRTIEITHYMEKAE